MLSDKQLKAIELLADKSMSRTKISEVIDVERKTLYNWLKNEEFVNALKKVTQIRLELVEARIKSDTEYIYEKGLNLIDNAQSENVRAEMIKYYLDRGLGKASTKVEMSIDNGNTQDQESKRRMIDMLKNNQEEIIEAEYEVKEDN